MVRKLANIKVVDIEITKMNPREEFDVAALKELGESIKQQGLIQPILVRPKGRKYELAVGERRLRAVRMAKIHKIPAVIDDLTDQDILEMQLTENLLREDLNPLEEATGLLRLRDEAGMTEAEIGKGLGKSQPWVSDRIRLLGLPKKMHQHISRGILGTGHAKAMLKLKSKKDQLACAKQLTRYDGEFQPSVRETERVVNNYLEDQEEREEFEKVYRKAKVKKCPDCGNKAVKINREVKGKTALTCRKFGYYGEKGHNWDPETGEKLKTQDEIQAEKERKARAKEVTAVRKKRLAGGKHIPTMPAWIFSKASKEEWAVTILKEASKDLYWAQFGPPRHYSPERAEAVFQATFSSNPLTDESVLIQPIEDRPAAKGFKTKITIGDYRSTRSQADNVAREKENVDKVKAAIKKLLDFQRKKIGVKQTAKDIMIKEVDGFKLGSKVKVAKDFSIKSYQGAGAEIVGFDQDGRAVLNYSKTQKVVGIEDLELVEKKGEKVEKLLEDMPDCDKQKVHCDTCGCDNVPTKGKDGNLFCGSCEALIEVRTKGVAPVIEAL